MSLGHHGYRDRATILARLGGRLLAGRLSCSTRRYEWVRDVVHGFAKIPTKIGISRLSFATRIFASSRGDFAEIYPAVQIEIEPAIGIDVNIDQRREAAIIFPCHTTVPGWFGKHRLQHARVHIDERGL